MKLILYSNIGAREKNEDRFAYHELPNGDQLFIVADGMGGYDAGEFAAESAIEAIVASLSETPDSIPLAIERANRAIAEKRLNLGVSEMGCTLAAVLLHQKNAKVFWAGDSRVFIIRNDRVVFETEDHSLINEMRRIKRLTPAQIRKYEHIVRRSLMGNSTDEVEIIERPVLPGDEVLICSDGFHKEIPLPILLEKLRIEEDFRIDNEKFIDNHTLIYFKIDNEEVKSL